MIDNVNSGGKLGASDHDLISFDLCCFNKVFQADKLVLDFSKADFVSLQSNLALDWYSLLVDLDPCDAWSVFHS